jgi:hypothetical protein
MILRPLGSVFSVALKGRMLLDALVVAGLVTVLFVCGLAASGKAARSIAAVMTERIMSSP